MSINPRRIPRWFTTSCLVIALICALVSLTNALQMLSHSNGQDVKRERPIVKESRQEVETPKDGMVYVWPLPDHGLQSFVILNVVDGQTVDAALLLPVRLQINGIEANAGKAARDALDKMLTGQIRTAQLWGTASTGVQADFWVADANGGKGAWSSKLMVNAGHAKSNAAPKK